MFLKDTGALPRSHARSCWGDNGEQLGRARAPPPQLLPGASNPESSSGRAGARGRGTGGGRGWRRWKWWDTVLGRSPAAVLLHLTPPRCVLLQVNLCRGRKRSPRRRRRLCSGRNSSVRCTSTSSTARTQILITGLSQQQLWDVRVGSHSSRLNKTWSHLNTVKYLEDTSTILQDFFCIEMAGTTACAYSPCGPLAP